MSSRHRQVGRELCGESVIQGHPTCLTSICPLTGKRALISRLDDLFELYVPDFRFREPCWRQHDDVRDCMLVVRERTAVEASTDIPCVNLALLVSRQKYRAIVADLQT